MNTFKNLREKLLMEIIINVMSHPFFKKKNLNSNFFNSLNQSIIIVFFIIKFLYFNK